jgi:magnesium-transporting ATPase (P-type)
MDHHTDEFWSVPESGLLEKLGTSAGGLGTDEALRRLAGNSRNILKPSVETEWLPILLSQFKSPIIIILLFAAVLSFFLSSPVDALIILAIVFVSGLLGFWQEYGAATREESPQHGQDKGCRAEDRTTAGADRGHCAGASCFVRWRNNSRHWDTRFEGPVC